MRPTFAEQEFRKATHSEPNRTCVQVARRGGWVELRDDKTEFGSLEDQRLVLTDEEFEEFLSGKTDGPHLTLSSHPSGDFLLSAHGAELRFTPDEIVAFKDGIEKGEFSEGSFTL